MELKAKQEANKAFFGKAYCSDYEEYVCVDAMGRLLKPDYVTIAFRKLLRKNGLRHIRFHDLRHSCASLLLALGYSLKEIQVNLGHGDISTTMNIYAHVESSVKQTMIEGITKALRVPEKR